MAPGVYLAVSLAFWPAIVAVEDENIVDAYRRSWTLADGNRWSILGTAFGTLVVAAAIAGIGSLIGGPFLASAAGALAWVFVLAVLVEAYRDLADVGSSPQ